MLGYFVLAILAIVLLTVGRNLFSALFALIGKLLPLFALIGLFFILYFLFGG